MDCNIKQSNYLDLKFEDNDEHYLINSLLGFQKNDSDIYIDEHIHHHHSKQHQNCSYNSNPHLFEDHIIEQVSAYICFRTTSLMDIFQHIEQHYPIPNQKKNTIILAIKKHKLRLKRDHTKAKLNIQKYKPELLNQIIPTQIKQEQSQGSPFVFDDQSQQTRKKKRNRMSAQNSRDKKKQYIQQIQNQNQQLKKKLKTLQQRNNISDNDRDFIKTILNLGIVSYLNFHQSLGQSSPVTYMTQQCTDQYDLSYERQKYKVSHENLSIKIGLLSQKQQKVVYQTLGCLGQTQYSQCTEISYEKYLNTIRIYERNQ